MRSLLPPQQQQKFNILQQDVVFFLSKGTKQRPFPKVKCVQLPTPVVNTYFHRAWADWSHSSIFIKSLSAHSREEVSLCLAMFWGAKTSSEKIKGAGGVRVVALFVKARSKYSPVCVILELSQFQKYTGSQLRSPIPSWKLCKAILTADRWKIALLALDK